MHEVNRGRGDSCVGVSSALFESLCICTALDPAFGWPFPWKQSDVMLFKFSRANRLSGQQDGAVGTATSRLGSVSIYPEVFGCIIVDYSVLIYDQPPVDVRMLGIV